MPNKMKTDDAKFLKELFAKQGDRMSFKLGTRPVGAVDEKQLVIHDLCVCLQGEALGHGVWLDEAFIKKCVEQGNAAENGMLCHFGHEDSNASRIKNYMGVLSNFVEKPAKDHEGGDCVGCYADIKFSKTAEKMSDNVAWVMGLARERPDALGLSIVFSVDDYKVKCADGNDLTWRQFVADNEQKFDDADTFEAWSDLLEAFYAQSADGKLYVVLDKLYGADFVAEGAATDGLFEAGKRPMAPSAPESLAATDADAGEGSSPTSPTPEAAQAEGGESAAETNHDCGTHGTQPESTEAQPQEAAQPTAEDGEGTPREDDTTSGADAQGEEVAKMKAACDKRISGFQSMHDKTVAELNAKMQVAADKWLDEKKDLERKVEMLTKELEAAQADASALREKFEKATEELAACRDRLSSVEKAHRKLTGGTLTIGEGERRAKTMAEFVKDHGDDFARAVREDPEMYKRICAARGCEPVALRYV